MVPSLRSGLASNLTRLAPTATKFAPLKRSFCSSRVTTQETEKLAKNTMQTMQNANAENAYRGFRYREGYREGSRDGRNNETKKACICTVSLGIFLGAFSTVSFMAKHDLLR